MTVAGVEPLCRPSPADLTLREATLRRERMERSRLEAQQRPRREAWQSESPLRAHREKAASVTEVAPPPVRERTEEVIDVAPALTDRAALAAEIVRQGRIRRGELVVPLPKPRTEREQLALAIIASGKKRHRQQLTAHEREALAAVVGADQDEELSPPAKALVSLNWKRHGGLDAAGQRWLADYFGKVDATRELLR